MKDFKQESDAFRKLTPTAMWGKAGVAAGGSAVMPLARAERRGWEEMGTWGMAPGVWEREAEWCRGWV